MRDRRRGGRGRLRRELTSRHDPLSRDPRSTTTSIATPVNGRGHGVFPKIDGPRVRTTPAGQLAPAALGGKWVMRWAFPAQDPRNTLPTIGETSALWTPVAALR